MAINVIQQINRIAEAAVKIRDKVKNELKDESLKNVRIDTVATVLNDTDTRIYKKKTKGTLVNDPELVVSGYYAFGEDGIVDGAIDFGVLNDLINQINRGDLPTYEDGDTLLY